ncbi:hypothetical protein HOT81_gp023 [Gordonia phage Fryberger]|uniref:Uncharacterized protein n=1 Tax=Gordonia phage Fryberger TaxID=2250392 RepID=A0A346FCH7_9CAUD|nr:hypothetical protein HOT81_gp023 [Gordonia phage Fryberger]AXN53441.1 hypothetical protein SEA_FRYBERGER_23 [Gordonia phage Fryberger]
MDPIDWVALALYLAFLLAIYLGYDFGGNRLTAYSVQAMKNQAEKKAGK